MNAQFDLSKIVNQGFKMEGAAQEITLTTIAIHGLQHFKLSFIFDTFSNYLQFQTMTQFNNTL
jgi:hypothetical protein